MTAGKTDALSADRAITNYDHDRFGFSTVAKSLATSVVSAASSDGMVIAVEGKWGSGKSSLINLMHLEIGKRPSNDVSVIRFAPWLIGERDQYVFALTDALAKEIEKRVDGCAGGGHALAQQRARENAERLREYGAQATDVLGHLASFAGLFNPILLIVGSGFSLTSRLLKQAKKETSIEKRKAEISDILKEQNHRFVVLLDDLDRLEPKEVVEVMRLIRSVADFPNVIYILCYDRDILAHAVEKGLSVEDGDAYLQKIVQVTFRVPRPESFDLRHWLSDEAVEVYGQEFPKQVHESELVEHPLSDLTTQVDYFGGRMNTPRDVVSVLNSIRFHFPPVKDDVHYPDLVCLHTIKITWPELYEWIERYFVEWPLIATGDARISDGEAERFGRELRAMLNPDDKAAFTEIFHLQELIPGILPEIENGIVTVFDRPSGAVLSGLSQTKRIGSPEHTRFYFAFSSPRLAMSPREIEQIVELASTDLPSLQAHLVDLANKKRPINGTWFEYLIDRLRREPQSDWSETALSNFAIALASVMDEVMKSPALRDAWGRPQVDAPASEFAYRLLNLLKERNHAERDQTLRKMIKSGEAFVWLLDEFVTQELRRQGYFKWTAEPKSTWSLSKDESEFARTTVLNRLKTRIDRERLFESNRLASPLFRWRDLCDGDASPASAWFDEYSRTDEAFLHVIAGLSSRVNSSDRGIYYTLPRRNVEPFTDWSAAIKRLEGIAQNSEKNPDLQARALQLLEDLDEDN